MDQNSMVDEVDYNALWKRIIFSVDAFPDEIQLFKNSILALTETNPLSPWPREG